ncbi:DUF1700 domain-containing protein [Halobacillus salinus]|uniref:DUF1700 domain-containing protein n=1 Tax=Halobacillus salinus TaxID=192814 RepID=A0A4Z0GZX8_9BACI|nr:DUF1700 domain-containing protein [Halobacillus salinus]TGB03728.1 DUF1700 domain-containing protein [Halobacillus salinus]
MHNTIEDYLSQLEDKLRELPANERRVHLNEIRDHLMEAAAEEGKSEQEIVNSFLSPEQLSQDILKEEQNRVQKTSFENPDYWFGITVTSVVAPFGALALPFIFDDIDIGLFVPFLLQFIVAASALFGYYKDRLTTRRGDILKQVGRIMIPVLAIPFGLFSIDIMQSGDLSTFNLVYLACYLLVWLATYIALRNVYLSHSKVVID